MGIPGLGKAIGNAERIALSRLAVRHLEVAKRPIRIAVDISIWLFQLQAGRGGQNPELRTLFFRLIRLLALPIHPLFVYDGKKKPPFKRGKATSSRSYGSAPIIRLSKILIDLFKFPRHDAPGEAEAECARLQQLGIVDAVMSNDVDTLMFGSGLTVMNFSKEKSTGTAAATHVDCYTTETQLDVTANIKLSRAGMILFAMLSGGDYLPSGVPKCGPTLAGEIAMAGFGEHLLDIINTDADQEEINNKLDEWRERLQYELDENESGWFHSKHKAVRIPETFPDPQILSFYAKPVVSVDTEIEHLRGRLAGAWDGEINALELRQFVADFFDWKYRSGARKLVRNLAEPLIITRLRLGRSPVAMFGYGSYTPNSELPLLQRIYRSRSHFSTGCVPQVQLEIVPIDVVGLDLDAEEPNPPPESSQLSESGVQPVEEEDEAGNETGNTESIAPKVPLPKKPYDPFEPEKIWVFETVANLGVPEVVERWKKQEAEKKMPKKPVVKKTTARKKKVIDPSMKPGGILRYTTVTKSGNGMTSAKQGQIVDATSTSSSLQELSSQSSHGLFNSHASIPPKSSQSLRGNRHAMRNSALTVDDLAGQFSVSCSIANEHTEARSSHLEVRRPGSGFTGPLDTFDRDTELESYATFSPSHSPYSLSPARFKISYTAADSLRPPDTESRQQPKSPLPLSTPTPRRSRRIKVQQPDCETSLETSLESLHLSPSKPITQINISGNTKRCHKSDLKLLKESASQPIALAHKPSSTAIKTKPGDIVTSQDEYDPQRLRKKKQQPRKRPGDEKINSEGNVSTPISVGDGMEEHSQGTCEQPRALVETIHTHKGFWTVELREREGTDSIDGAIRPEENKDSEKKKPGKKRIARVSYLDLR